MLSTLIKYFIDLGKLAACSLLIVGIMTRWASFWHIFIFRATLKCTKMSSVLSLNLVVVLNHRYEKCCFWFLITVTEFTLDWQVVLLFFLRCNSPDFNTPEILPHAEALRPRISSCGMLFVYKILSTRFWIYIHLSLSNILGIWYRVMLLDLYWENDLGCSCPIWIRVKAESA